MAAFKAKDQMRTLRERLKLLLRNITLMETEDANKWPILQVTRGSENAWVKIDDTGVGLRIDSVTGQAQRFYSPHKIAVIKDSASTSSFTVTVSDWETGESVIPSANGTPGSSVAFNTDNNTSASDLAAEIATLPGVMSATALAGVITVTYSSYAPVALTFAVSGGDGISLVQSAVSGADLELRDVVMIQAALLGMATSIYSKASPASFDLTGAYLEARIKADPYNQGTSGSFQ